MVFYVYFGCLGSDIIGVEKVITAAILNIFMIVGDFNFLDCLNFFVNFEVRLFAF